MPIMKRFDRLLARIGKFKDEIILDQDVLRDIDIFRSILPPIRGYEVLVN